MTDTIDRAALGRANRRKGITAEQALARYLREHGWPAAARAVVTGYRTPTATVADPGDIRGTPGLVWSVKAYAPEAIERNVPGWLDQLDAMHPLGDLVGGLPLLVVKRPGHTDPGRWWCYLRLATLDRLRGAPGMTTAADQPARLTVATTVDLLHRNAYGTHQENAHAHQ